MNFSVVWPTQTLWFAHTRRINLLNESERQVLNPCE